MKRLLIFPFLAACAQIGGPLDPGFPEGASDTCNGSQHARLIGQPASVLETRLLLQPVRMISPDQAVTMDHVSDRVNFHVSATRIIEQITCG